MAKLIMLMGIPASGKSTWAQDYVSKNPDTVIVEKDQIRLELARGGWTWTPDGEKADVIPERDKQIEEALRAGLSVVSADTNLQREHRTQLQKLARRYSAEFVVERLDVPLSDCLERNTARTQGRVPDKAVKDMYYKYVVNDPDHWPKSAPSVFKPVPVTKRDDLAKALICDLDGTLAHNNGHRSFYDASTADKDELVPHIRRLIRAYHDHLVFQIIYMSGREERDREPTERFLKLHDCPPGPLYMRPTGDTRKDRIVKLELFDTHVRDKYSVDFVLDDRNQVVKMWRELGLPCLQVADGDY